MQQPPGKQRSSAPSRKASALHAPEQWPASHAWPRLSDLGREPLADGLTPGQGALARDTDRRRSLQAWLAPTDPGAGPGQGRGLPLVRQADLPAAELQPAGREDVRAAEAAVAAAIGLRMARWQQQQQLHQQQPPQAAATVTAPVRGSDAGQAQQAGAGGRAGEPLGPRDSRGGAHVQFPVAAPEVNVPAAPTPAGIAAGTAEAEAGAAVATALEVGAGVGLDPAGDALPQLRGAPPPQMPLPGCGAAQGATLASRQGPAATVAISGWKAGSVDAATAAAGARPCTAGTVNGPRALEEGPASGVPGGVEPPAEAATLAAAPSSIPYQPSPAPLVPWAATLGHQPQPQHALGPAQQDATRPQEPGDPVAASTPACPWRTGAHGAGGSSNGSGGGNGVQHPAAPTSVTGELLAPQPAAAAAALSAGPSSALRAGPSTAVQPPTLPPHASPHVAQGGVGLPLLPLFRRGSIDGSWGSFGDLSTCTTWQHGRTFGPLMAEMAAGFAAMAAGRQQAHGQGQRDPTHGPEHDSGAMYTQSTVWSSIACSGMHVAQGEQQAGAGAQAGPGAGVGDAGAHDLRTHSSSGSGSGSCGLSLSMPGRSSSWNGVVQSTTSPLDAGARGSSQRPGNPPHRTAERPDAFGFLTDPSGGRNARVLAGGDPVAGGGAARTTTTGGTVGPGSLWRGRAGTAAAKEDVAGTAMLDTAGTGTGTGLGTGASSSSSRTAVDRYGALLMSSTQYKLSMYDVHDALLLSKLQQPQPQLQSQARQRSMAGGQQRGGPGVAGPGPGPGQPALAVPLERRVVGEGEAWVDSAPRACEWGRDWVVSLYARCAHVAVLSRFGTHSRHRWRPLLVAVDCTVPA